MKFLKLLFSRRFSYADLLSVVILANLVHNNHWAYAIGAFLLMQVILQYMEGKLDEYHRFTANDTGTVDNS